MPASELDCLTCGACCRTGADGRILIPEEDLVRWRRSGRNDIANAVQPGHFGLVGFATDENGACVHLGTKESPNACQIYDVRGTTCREFERGSWQCLEFRRDAGIDIDIDIDIDSGIHLDMDSDIDAEIPMDGDVDPDTEAAAIEETQDASLPRRGSPANESAR